MPLRNLAGRSLSAMGLGCMTLIGWYGQRNDDEARATVLEALERGITHFDTAQSYQNGDNEKFIGGLLAAQREQVFIASKYGITRDSNGTMVIDNHPDALRQAVDASLKRLNTDYIDLFYLHRIDSRIPIEDSVGALKELVDSGKLRAIGLSECSAQTLQRAYAIHPIAAVQSEYSLWSREPERDILPTCRELKVAFVAYSPMGRGFLAGNFAQASDLPANDVRKNQPRFVGTNAEHNQRIVEVIKAFAAQHQASAAQVAIAWVLAQGAVHGVQIHVIPGMKTRAHLRDNLAAIQLNIDSTVWQNLAATIAEFKPAGERHPPAMMAVVNR